MITLNLHWLHAYIHLYYYRHNMGYYRGGVKIGDLIKSFNNTYDILSRIPDKRGHICSDVCMK